MKYFNRFVGIMRIVMKYLKKKIVGLLNDTIAYVNGVKR